VGGQKAAVLAEKFGSMLAVIPLLTGLEAHRGSLVQAQGLASSDAGAAHR
jgi:hypothetical protein